MIKLALIQFANLIGPQKTVVRTIGLPDMTIGGTVYARTFDEVVIAPHRWQVKLAHWVLGDVRESRIDWNNIPPYESRFNLSYGTASADEKRQFGYERDYLKSDIARSLSDWGVQYDSNWNFAPRRRYKIRDEGKKSKVVDLGPRYDSAYYQKLRLEIEDLLCVDDPRHWAKRFNLFKGGMPQRQSGVVF
jgi:hypothetical protein